jgi:hypothetical protein
MTKTQAYSQCQGYLSVLNLNFLSSVGNLGIFKELSILYYLPTLKYFFNEYFYNLYYNIMFNNFYTFNHLGCLILQSNKIVHMFFPDQTHFTLFDTGLKQPYLSSIIFNQSQPFFCIVLIFFECLCGRNVW